MDLSKLTPKDKELYEIMKERKIDLICELNKGIVPEDFSEVIYMIMRAEYKRGKADGSAESVKNTNEVEDGKS